MNFIHIVPHHKEVLRKVNRLRDQHYGLTNIEALNSISNNIPTSCLRQDGTLILDYNNFKHLISKDKWFGHTKITGFVQVIGLNKKVVRHANSYSAP